MRIALLSEVSQAAHTLAQWFYDEWPDYYGSWSMSEIERDVLRGMNTTSLPVTLVAHNNGDVYGTSSLRDKSIDSYNHLSPWIGGLLVKKSQRGQGIGTRLIQETAKLAQGLGYNTIYGATHHADQVFIRAGWKIFDQSVYGDKPISIFSYCGLVTTARLTSR
jgi:predicted N-acetyltransferase YhbS